MLCEHCLLPHKNIYKLHICHIRIIVVAWWCCTLILSHHGNHHHPLTWQQTEPRHQTWHCFTVLSESQLLKGVTNDIDPPPPSAMNRRTDSPAILRCETNEPNLSCPVPGHRHTKYGWLAFHSSQLSSIRRSIRQVVEKGAQWLRPSVTIWPAI